jgi:hypothetical protein
MPAITRASHTLDGAQGQAIHFVPLPAQKYSVDIPLGVLHHLFSMTRKLFAEIKLRGSSLLSNGALACPDGQREPANAGRPVAIRR